MPHPCRPSPSSMLRLDPVEERCRHCGHWLRLHYHNRRTVETLAGRVRLTLGIRLCLHPACPRHRQPYRPEAEGAWALPGMQFGLDVIAFVGHARFFDHRSVPEIHQRLLARGVVISERSVTHLLHRYEELVALRLAARPEMARQLATQGRVVLAIDGMQPDREHEVLWVVRDVLSGALLLARSLPSSEGVALAGLLREVVDALAALGVPVVGVVSDGQQSIRQAVQATLGAVPHQLCQFHYLREAAKSITTADSQAKVTLKQQVRGLRHIERAVAARPEAEAAVAQGYCQAVRGALAGDARSDRTAPGVALWSRLEAIRDSLARLPGCAPTGGEKRGGATRH